MVPIGIKVVKALALLICVLSFLVLLTGGLVTWKNPQLVGSFITRLAPSVTPAPVSIKGIAVLGDSQSDEYQANDARGGGYTSSTFNWVELLHNHRNINVGELGNWKEPRREGYEYNWARTGATTYSALASGQHIGIAEQVKEGKVNVVILYIGANDFAPYITENGYEAIYDGTMDENEVIEKVNRVVADITTAIDVIKKAGDVHIILVKIPNWGNHVGVQVAFPFPDQRDRVTRAITLTNDRLQKMADEQNIPTINPDAVYAQLVHDQFRIGNTTLQLFLLNNDPKSVFLDDGVHPGTVLNGLFANEVIATLNTKVGTSIKLFTKREILNNAGIF